MVGAKILGLGVLFLVIGIVFAGGHILHLFSNPFIFAGGMLSGIIGIVLMVIAFVALATSEYAPEGIRAGDQNAFSLALLRCMLSISVADNVLDEEEITTLQKIYKHLTHNDLSAELIRETAKVMMEVDTNIETELGTMVDTLDKASKDKLILASLYILAADGDMDERELLMLDDIRAGLRLSRSHVEKMKKKFLKNKNLTLSKA